MYLLPAAHTHCYELRDGRWQAAWSHATAVSSQALKGPVLQPSDLWRSTARHPHMPRSARTRSRDLAKKSGARTRRNLATKDLGYVV
jgi:hypothetical protein